LGKNAMSEVQRVVDIVSRLPNDLTRYGFLMHLLRFDEALFFAAVRSNVPFIMPLIYTPLVGEACVHYSDLKVPPRGLIIGIDKAGSVRDVLRSHPAPEVDVIVVTDGGRILGLGDLGANGHGIPVGKLILYSACGGVHPSRCLPVTLDVGCDTESVTSNPSYIGLKHKRVNGKRYADFVDEFMQAVAERFGVNCLVQFEDFGNDNALSLLTKYRNDYCCFNDDIQGTAAVALAGLFSAIRVDGVEKLMSKHRFLFLGAGSAGLGIASLIVLDLVQKGMPRADAARCCWFFDSRGLVYKGRDHVSPAKADFAHEIDAELRSVAEEVGGDGFEAIVKKLKPTGIIGVSTVAGAFTSGVLRAMAAVNNEQSNNKRPIVFALSNPVSKSECTAEEAYAETDGRAVFASGSPFSPITLLDGSVRVPGQVCLKPILSFWVTKQICCFRKREIEHGIRVGLRRRTE
jgi:malate dehydrogenase (oxaloacetate-decarboxylating)(NADP+)